MPSAAACWDASLQQGSKYGVVVLQLTCCKTFISAQKLAGGLLKVWRDWFAAWNWMA